MTPYLYMYMVNHLTQRATNKEIMT